MELAQINLATSDVGQHFTSCTEFVELTSGLLLSLLHAIIIFYFLDLRFVLGNGTDREKDREK